MLNLLFLKEKEELRIKRGHPWVFDNEIRRVEGDPQPGEFVEVFSARQKLLGQGYFNARSKIRVRLLSHGDRFTEGINPEQDFDALFQRRLDKAIERRKKIINGQEAYRLIFSEGDRLPGLVVDRYGQVLVVQFLTLGMELRRERILSFIEQKIPSTVIYERSDSKAREQEGLKRRSGFLKGAEPEGEPFIFKENGLSFELNLKGQKTGFFLDQRENRQALKAFVRNAKVLDCFCYTGGFALIAAAGGAQDVWGIDSSAAAIDQARINMQKNGLANIRFETKDVFEELREFNRKGALFDVIVLDPPAFAKQKKDLKFARAGYKDINLRAMRILKRGGILMSCSCSHYVSKESFVDIIKLAARDVKRPLKILEVRTQAADHPVIAGVPETSYLKCIIAKVS